MNWFILHPLFLSLFHLPHLSSSYRLCLDSRTPFTPKTPLSFCHYTESVCCDMVEEYRIQKKFKSMNVVDPNCAALLKSILCARCDPLSSDLFLTKSGTRDVPILCTVANFSQPKSTTNDFCAKVWDTCKDVPILNSPFNTPYVKARTAVGLGSTFSKLTDTCQSNNVFCKAFGASSEDGAVCFNGDIISSSETPKSVNGVCLEKIYNGTYIHMVPHPDGSDRVFVANQEGKIWLATVPKDGSGGTLLLNESNPFLDLTDKVHYDTAYGLVAIAFHPSFLQNGRFFASFYCDEVQWKGCVGKCSCNSDINCDPSKLGSDDGSPPCQYHNVIIEFTVNGSAAQPSSATSANPSEVSTIFAMGLPFSGHHGGQILFGPDGYLYFMTGDGGSKGDPFNFAQNKKSFLGKVMRLDVDTMPSAKDIINLSLMGNYSIPRDNPFYYDKELRPEIWAFGFRNPWRCSFDAEKPSYFFCADSGQEEFEEVDIVTKGGNYGWRLYEGLFPFNTSALGGNTPSSISPIFPIMGYNHSNGSASIIGGYVYRSTTDPCMYGRYLYADLYGSAVYAGTETPPNSGNFTNIQIPFACARDSPIHCGGSVTGSSVATWGYVFSFAEDNRKDVYVLSANGVYRIAPPSRCSYSCSKEIGKGTRTLDQHLNRSHVSGSPWKNPKHKELLMLLISSSVGLFL